ASHSNQSGQNTVILIDEPELYLHPQAISVVCSALKQLSASGFQVLFSTHSPMMVSAEDAAETIVFWKCPQNGTKYRQKVISALAGIGSHQHQTDVLYSLNHSSQWLFSDKPVIVEGKTERLLLPAIFSAVTGKSLSQASVSLIESGGSGGSLQIAKLLKSLGYSPKVISDLDFAFKVAVPEGLIPATDPDLMTCIQWFAENAASNGFHLGTDGLPKKGGTLKPEAAYELLAQALPTECTSIHNILKAVDVWIWTKGAIEAHLGIQKTNTERANFTSQALGTNSIMHASDPSVLTQMAAWI
ncbi:MAG: AAA family ATPase, partial [Flavisolibacter sp.]|nr:AAA family ATPase [Flavisolibacter sp.]